ncbi:hypothetical protein KKF91_17685 [Myxococcota bacterium]|nr:hypothetical protein [Myxococcota bacterium]MBU1432374.1 hypothetical protein [Myxococcota bacterium]MBU1899877.1 hypothetical protein [Myxococcota bacterium]
MSPQEIMSPEVVDTNVLTIASAPAAGWVHPRIPLAELSLILKVLQWVMAFRDDHCRLLVMDVGKTIFEEYSSHSNMPEFLHYGRQVVQHKFSTGAAYWVELEYWNNGSERVARLPTEIEDLVHDLGDRKMIAAASKASAPIVNACDSDWSNLNEQRALQIMHVRLIQVLTAQERAHCREHGSH